MTEDKFAKITAQVIDTLEGGYYHPHHRQERPNSFRLYGSSGETMFGLDRHAGHGLYYSTPRKSKDVLTNLKYIESGAYTYKNNASKEFWQTLDNQGANKNWEWNYKGGSLNSRLKELASGIIYAEYQRLSNKYLSPKAKELVESDPRLTFHFSYAVWNGEGRFNSFADKINQAVASGITNTNELAQIALNSRLNSQNSLIRTGGEKIKKLWSSPSFVAAIDTSSSSSSSGEDKKKIVQNSIILSVVLIGGYVLLKTYKKI